MKLPQALLIVFLLIALNGCATLTHGTTQDIRITTIPPGADLIIDGRLYYTSPAIITMKRDADHTVEISREGYKSETVAIKRTVPQSGGNFNLGIVPVGEVVDALSGADRRLVPEKVKVRLRLLTPQETREASPKNLKNQLQRLNILRDEGKITPEQYNQLRQKIWTDAGKARISPPATQEP